MQSRLPCSNFSKQLLSTPSFKTSKLFDLHRSSTAHYLHKIMFDLAMINVQSVQSVQIRDIPLSCIPPCNPGACITYLKRLRTAIMSYIMARKPLRPSSEYNNAHSRLIQKHTSSSCRIKVARCLRSARELPVPLMKS